MELGIYTFGDRSRDPETGARLSAAQRMSNLLEVARLADEVGLDIIGVGERHGADFLTASGSTILAAMAAATRTIRLTSAVTLISTADPLRVHQDFATLDLVSGGRAEVMFGRGISDSNFELFGYDRADYDAVFAEKVALFEQLATRQNVSWSGRFRASLAGAEIEPRPVQPRLPVWIAASSQASLARAAEWGYPVALPLLAKDPQAVEAIARTGDLYRAAWAECGRPDAALRLATFSFMFVSDDDAAALDTYRRNFLAVMARAFPDGLGASGFDALRAPLGGLAVGEPQQVVDKILAIHERQGDTRHFGNIDVGAMPHRLVMRAIELLGTRVAPAVRRATAPSLSASTPMAEAQNRF